MKRKVVTNDVQAVVTAASFRFVPQRTQATRSLAAGSASPSANGFWEVCGSSRRPRAGAADLEERGCVETRYFGLSHIASY